MRFSPFIASLLTIILLFRQESLGAELSKAPTAKKNGLNFDDNKKSKRNPNEGDISQKEDEYLIDPITRDYDNPERVLKDLESDMPFRPKVYDPIFKALDITIDYASPLWDLMYRYTRKDIMLSGRGGIGILLWERDIPIYSDKLFKKII